jgi:hypothetical protein
VAEPGAPVVAQPGAPVVAEPGAPVVAEPVAPVAREPERSMWAEPVAPFAVEPEAPTAATQAPAGGDEWREPLKPELIKLLWVLVVAMAAGILVTAIGIGLTV